MWSKEWKLIKQIKIPNGVKKGGRKPASELNESEKMSARIHQLVLLRSDYFIRFLCWRTIRKKFKKKGEQKRWENKTTTEEKRKKGEKILISIMTIHELIFLMHLFLILYFLFHIYGCREIINAPCFRHLSFCFHVSFSFNVDHVGKTERISELKAIYNHTNGQHIIFNWPAS